MGEKSQQILHKESTQVANKHMERYSTSLVIREREIKTTIRYYYIPVKIAELKILTIPNGGEVLEELEFSHTDRWKVNYYNHFFKKSAIS